MFISIFIAYLQVEVINIYIKIEKGKAEVKNLYIVFPSYSFFHSLQRWRNLYMIYTLHIENSNT